MFTSHFYTWSNEQTGRKTAEHFFVSHLSHEPLAGKLGASAAQMASQRFENVVSPLQNGRYKIRPLGKLKILN